MHLIPKTKWKPPTTLYPAHPTTLSVNNESTQPIQAPNCANQAPTSNISISTKSPNPNPNTFPPPVTIQQNYKQKDQNSSKKVKRKDQIRKNKNLQDEIEGKWELGHEAATWQEV